MIRRLHFLITLLIAMLFQGIAIPVHAQDISIGTKTELEAFRDAVKGGNTYAGNTVTLTANIADVTGWEEGIGSETTPFLGTFDGGGHLITLTGFTGLFEQIGLNNNRTGTVKNLGVKAAIESYGYIGAIATYNYGTIQYCFVEGTITNNDNYTGGIAGSNYNTIEDCYSTVSIAVTADSYAAGIVGYNNGTLQRCYATGAITSTGTGEYAGAGGIAGCNGPIGTIKNNIALNESIAGKTQGRIVAENDGTLATNYASPAIPCTWNNTGANAPDGEGLTDDNFTGQGADQGAFATWNKGNSAWDFGNDNANLPTLTGITGQTAITRASVMPKPLITSIATADDLIAFRTAVNGGETYTGKEVTLTASFPANGWEEAIGSSDKPFLGTFNGGGHVITLTGPIGLFGQVGKSGETTGTVKNLGVKAQIDGFTDYIGAIAGSSYGTIQYCFVEGSIESSKDYLGGIVGKNVGAIEDCYTTVSIKATGIVKRVGGIAGFNYNINSNAGTIQRCYATGTINNINTNFGAGVGGIVGSNSAGTTIKNCIALNTSITALATGRIIISNYGGNDALADNYASPLIAGTWTEKEVGKKDGADLAAANFIGQGAGQGAFVTWTATAWDFGSDNANLPTLQGFTADQPVKGITRESVITDPLIKEIKNAGDLATFRDAVNSGKTYEGKTVTLANDITVTGWDAGIGIDNKKADDNKPFSGTFDGQGHVITLTGSTSLFGMIGNSNKQIGTVKNLGVKAAITANTTNAGGIAEHSYGTIQNCYTEGTIANDSTYTGGIAGDNGGTIQNCYSTASCTANYAAGGIVGKHSGAILQCYATGMITGKTSAGGIAGTFGGNKDLNNCIALNASITFTDTDPDTGGKSGRIISSSNASLLSNNYATPLLPGTADYMDTGKKDGAQLTKENFITAGYNKPITANQGAFTGWLADNWVFGDNTTLPTLQGFTADQPVKGITRKERMLKLTIDSADDLKAFRTTVDGGESFEGTTVKLTEDIEVKEWTGCSRAFAGTFDGQGHTITLTGNAGLFTTLAAGGTVQNLGVKATITTPGYGSIGSIAQFNDGTIRQCYITGEITSTQYSSYAGGIVGTNNNSGRILDCYSTASITVQVGAGGIAQINKGTIERCFATGAISGGDANDGSGGISGDNHGTIKNCIALNKSIKKVMNSGRITGTKNNGTLATNYASPLIPGKWGDKEGDRKDDNIYGADLTEATFIGQKAGEGAFAGWSADNGWDFGDNSNLPKLKTIGLTDNIVIGGQGDNDGNMPARAGFLELTIEINSAITYDADTHNGKSIRVKDKGKFTVNADGVSLKKLILDEGGQVETTTGFTCGQLLAPRTLSNKWTAYSSPVTMQVVATEELQFYYMRGYDDIDNQGWGTSGSCTAASLDMSKQSLIATEDSNVPVTFTATASDDSPVSIPADKAATEGEALNTGIFLFCANPTLKNVTLPVAYILSADGTRFERKENEEVKPFQSYIIANKVTSAAVLSLRAGDSPTSNDKVPLPDGSFRLWGSNGQLHLSADIASDVTIYDLSGRLIRQFTLTGERTLNLGHGLYLVRSNNITYKVSL